MWRIFVTMAVMAMLVPGTVAAQTPEATPASLVDELYECDGIPSYIAVHAGLGDDLSPQERRLVEQWAADEIDARTARPSESRTLSGAFDEMATTLEQVPEDQVPYAVSRYHAAKIDQYGMLANVYNAASNSDLISVSIYLDELQPVLDEIDEGWSYANIVCDDALTDAWDGAGS